MTFQGLHHVIVPVLCFFFSQLSESVVNRMKDSSQPSAGQQPAPGPAPALTVPVPTTPTPTTPVPSMPVPIAPPPSRGPQEGAFKAPQTGMFGEWEQRQQEICLAAAGLAFTPE